MFLYSPYQILSTLLPFFMGYMCNITKEKLLSLLPNTYNHIMVFFLFLRNYMILIINSCINVENRGKSLNKETEI